MCGTEADGGEQSIEGDSGGDSTSVHNCCKQWHGPLQTLALEEAGRYAPQASVLIAECHGLRQHGQAVNTQVVASCVLIRNQTLAFIDVI